MAYTPENTIIKSIVLRANIKIKIHLKEAMVSDKHTGNMHTGLGKS